MISVFSCDFYHPQNVENVRKANMQWRSKRFEPVGQSLAEGCPLVTVAGPPAKL